MICSPIAMDTYTYMTCMTYMSHFFLESDSSFGLTAHAWCLPSARSFNQVQPNPPPVAAESSFLIPPGPVPVFFVEQRVPGLSFVVSSYLFSVTFQSLPCDDFWHGFKIRQVFLEPQFFGAAFILIPQFGATQLQSFPFICLRSDPPHSPQKKSNKITPTPQDTQNIYPKMMSKIHVFFLWRGRSSEKKIRPPDIPTWMLWLQRWNWYFIASPTGSYAKVSGRKCAWEIAWHIWNAGIL